MLDVLTSYFFGYLYLLVAGPLSCSCMANIFLLYATYLFMASSLTVREYLTLSSNESRCY